jgi:hypothetical protein
MSRWLQLAEQADARISAPDNRDVRDNSPVLTPNVPNVTNVLALETPNSDVERAAIMEHDGNLSRSEAERLAGMNCPVAPTIEPGPGAAAEAWHAWLTHLLKQYRHHGDKAASLAFGVMLNRWHRLHRTETDSARCAGCENVLSESKVLDLPDGARVHNQPDCECLLAYGDKWQGVAVAGLADFGIHFRGDPAASTGS